MQFSDVFLQKKFENVLALSDSLQRQLEKFVEKKELLLNDAKIIRENEEETDDPMESVVNFRRRFRHPFLRRMTAVRFLFSIFVR